MSFTPFLSPPGPTFLRRVLTLGLASWLAVGAACGPAPVAKGPTTVASSVPAARPSAPVSLASTFKADEDAPIPVGPGDAVSGSASAPVTVVAFSDFQCPFCVKGHATMDRVLRRYGEDQVRFVFKHYPLDFHDDAAPAAESAQIVLQIAGPAAFFRFQDGLFDQKGDLDEGVFERLALEVGVPVDRFRAARAAHTGREKVNADVALGERLGVRGTPAFFINGVALQGAQPEAVFLRVVEAEREKAHARLAAGTPVDRLYAVLTAENLQNAPREEGTRPGHDEPGADVTVWKVPVDKAPVRGKATALVTAVVFSDYQCPFCKKLETTLGKLRQTFGDDLRLVWRHHPLPFHERAAPASYLALEARAQRGDGAFWAVHDGLFASAPSLSDGDLERIAASAGLDVKRAMNAVRQKTHAAALQRDEDLAEDLAAVGTPTTFVNGRRVSGAVPLEVFEKVIAEERDNAKARVGAGTAPAALYDALQATAKGPPEPERIPVALPAVVPSRGPAAAPVVIQEFADFQCPFCGRAEAALEELRKAYPTKVRIVWRDLPLPMHPDAALAAEAARAAFAQGGDGAFWKMHKKLLEKQTERGGLAASALEGYARELGLDVPRFKAALDGRTFRALVEADTEAATQAGIQGTPTFLVNDIVVRGAQPLSKFKRAVERALATKPPRAK